mgnify:FL=1
MTADYTEAGFSGCSKKVRFTMNELLVFLSSIMDNNGNGQEHTADFNALAAETGDMEWMLNAFVKESIRNRTELQKSIEGMKTDKELLKGTLHRMYPTWEQLGIDCELETYYRILHDDESDDMTITAYTETIIKRIESLVSEAGDILSDIKALNEKNETDEIQNIDS